MAIHLRALMCLSLKTYIGMAFVFFFIYRCFSFMIRSLYLFIDLCGTQERADTKGDRVAYICQCIQTCLVKKVDNVHRVSSFVSS